MRSFIAEVVAEILEKQPSIEEVVFILPSKRAGTFLRNEIAKQTNRTLFAPQIYSIEEFVEKLSGLSYASNAQLIFELYNSYLNSAAGEKENFHDFSKWGQTLLQDFNEVDRHLIDPKTIFGNLAAVQEINHWSLQAGKTKMMEGYLRFWNSIEKIYGEFNQNLIKKGLGHQGLVYRLACNQLETYQAKNKNLHVFIGFNALNKAESQIIQSMLVSSNAEIFWDIDTSFLDDPIHDAGYFIREYQKTWPYLKTKQLQGPSNHYKQSKSVRIIGVPKYVSQAKYVGHLLKNIHEERPEDLLDMALVLGDENLLNPILNSVPNEINAVNITMGYPVQKTILATLFEQFFELYIRSDSNGWYHRPIVEFLLHPYIDKLLEGDSKKVVQSIKTKNLTYLSAEKIKTVSDSGNPNIALLFFDEVTTPKQFLAKCSTLVHALKNTLENQVSELVLEHLYRFHNLFNQICDLLETYDFITDLKSLYSLFTELLSAETLDFEGNPLEGLQIMGMLESRNLDFETVIITSVNEGILPSGKSTNSFIPFDLKKYYGLPTYKEKDAVYTYHFYRLLQRAKNVFILYNTEPDVLEGGEKSRLISQLLSDEQRVGDIEEIIASPKTNPLVNVFEVVKKNKSLIELIRAHAGNGFSPSSLSNYIRNPLDFYKQSLLGIEDTLGVEETVAFNTFGTVVHDSLEDLYTPLVGEYLSESNLMALKPKIEGLVKHHFSKNYLEGDITHGKNLIAYHVIKRYLERFIDLEIKEAHSHQIKILGLEEKLKIALEIPEVDFPVFLKGKLDRIDEKDGVLRIIDYKTGNVVPKNVTISNWEDIITDYDYSKAFQLLCYAQMYRFENASDSLEAGIITFKNLNGGLQKLTMKDLGEKKGKHYTIDTDVLKQFQTMLYKLILEICDINTPFTEKEV